jgi:hypothetical protein
MDNDEFDKIIKGLQANKKGQNDKQLIASALRWANPKERERQAALTKAAWENPDVRKKKTESAIEASNRQDVINKRKAALADEEKIAKRRASQKIAQNKPGVKTNQAEKQSKPIATPNGIFASMRIASEAYNLSQGTMLYRLRTKPTEYYYITKEEYAAYLANK